MLLSWIDGKQIPNVFGLAVPEVHGLVWMKMMLLTMVVLLLLLVVVRAGSVRETGPATAQLQRLGVQLRRAESQLFVVEANGAETLCLQVPAVAATRPVAGARILLVHHIRGTSPRGTRTTWI